MLVSGRHDRRCFGSCDEFPNDFLRFWKTRSVKIPKLTTISTIEHNDNEKEFIVILYVGVVITFLSDQVTRVGCRNGHFLVPCLMIAGRNKGRLVFFHCVFFFHHQFFLILINSKMTIQPKNKKVSTYSLKCPKCLVPNHRAKKTFGILFSKLFFSISCRQI